MKRVLLTLALVMAMSHLTLSQTTGAQAVRRKIGPDSLAEQEIMKLEKELVRAGLRGDAATTDRLMADEYFFMTRDGVVHENLKASLLLKMKAGESGADLMARMDSTGDGEPGPQPANIDEAQVHVYGDTGVVVVRSAYKVRGKDGSVVEIPTRYLHVWARQNGRWQLVTGSSTRIERAKP
jgi:hypothetical protein